MVQHFTANLYHYGCTQTAITSRKCTPPGKNAHLLEKMHTPNVNLHTLTSQNAHSSDLSLKCIN